MQDIELYQNLFKDTIRMIPLRASLLLLKNAAMPDQVMIVDFYSKANNRMWRGKSYSFKGSILEPLFTQADTIVVENLSDENLNTPLEQEALLSHGGNAAVIHPLINAGKLIGCFIFIHDNAKEAEKHQSLTVLTADIFALAMEKTACPNLHSSGPANCPPSSRLAVCWLRPPLISNRSSVIPWI